MRRVGVQVQDIGVQLCTISIPSLGIDTGVTDNAYTNGTETEVGWYEGRPPRFTSSPTPMSMMLKLSPGQAHDGKSASDMLNGIGKDHILLVDAAYDSDALRQKLAGRGAWANVDPCRDASTARRSAACSPPAPPHRALLQ
jgi:hypothetical protein